LINVLPGEDASDYSLRWYHICLFQSRVCDKSNCCNILFLLVI